ncbi:hypothetical protein GBA52_028547 [Prunus armeniaca]|nr:hypothetical protein GBA52_028547 [Prunus armeniaca]
MLTLDNLEVTQTQTLAKHLTVDQSQVLNQILSMSLSSQLTTPDWNSILFPKTYFVQFPVGNS